MSAHTEALAEALRSRKAARSRDAARDLAPFAGFAGSEARCAPAAGRLPWTKAPLGGQAFGVDLRLLLASLAITSAWALVIFEGWHQLWI